MEALVALVLAVPCVAPASPSIDVPAAEEEGWILLDRAEAQVRESGHGDARSLVQEFAERPVEAGFGGFAARRTAPVAPGDDPELQLPQSPGQLAPDAPDPGDRCDVDREGWAAFSWIPGGVGDGVVESWGFERGVHEAGRASARPVDKAPKALAARVAGAGAERIRLTDGDDPAWGPWAGFFQEALQGLGVFPRRAPKARRAWKPGSAPGLAGVAGLCAERSRLGHLRRGTRKALRRGIHRRAKPRRTALQNAGLRRGGRAPAVFIQVAGEGDRGRGQGEPSSGRSAGAASSIRVGTAELPSGPRRVVVSGGAQRPGCGERFLRTALAAMPALEQVAGFPLPERGDVLVRVHGDSKATGGYAGQIEGLVVDLVDTATNYDLVHELAHGWFSDRFVVSRDRADRWVIEGLATYAAIQACRVQPALGDAASWHAQALARRTRDPAERPYLSSRGTRYPMREGTDDEAFAFDWYARAYAFLHLLEARLGEAGLRALNRRIAAESPRLPYLYLAEIRAVDPDGVRLLGGWHTTDDFHRAMHPDRLSDADGDGLSAAHEQALGTRDDALDSDGDGASDGCEYWWFRSDPASAESVPPEPRALKAKETTAWWRLGGSTGEAWDAARDVPREFSAVHDVRSLHVHADEAWITIAATFHRSPPPDLVLQLGIDKDGDDDYELVFQARPGQHPEFCRLDGRWEGVDWRLVSLERVEARGIELRFALPRAMLGADLAGEVRVFGGTLGLDSTESLVYADSISDWLSLNLP